MLSLEVLPRKFRHPAAQAAQIKESKSSRVRRTQQTPLKGQALPYSLKEYRKRKPTHLPPPEAAQTAEKEKPPCPQGTEASFQRTSSALLSQGILKAQAYPSAPAGGGPSSRKRKASVPAGHKHLISKDKPCLSFPGSGSAKTSPPRRPPQAAQTT